ncbi:hypothetical protein C789_959 [Microcystis aeruginosa FACHB-905 = DIANCHI905]|uniref:Uncharacterized protein n=1 Tax=Microcystis aeruginosa PCC 7806SL TaxID=1903187 RepID=A0AB33C3P7_MICA7|nr:hypothetical protein BH695_3767 [Microcystis aeruginosa PCC 7806SL]ELS49248.1 hypothetical protein C789_959 [Microcystis aeruginosa FACHB-905 = DIANCHI905]
METHLIFPRVFFADNSLYSLEKLIEWKRASAIFLNLFYRTLYSLEKLIEWKLAN